jgi:hypothetical protein
VGVTLDLAVFLRAQHITRVQLYDVDPRLLSTLALSGTCTNMGSPTTSSSRWAPPRRRQPRAPFRGSELQHPGSHLRYRRERQGPDRVALRAPGAPPDNPVTPASFRPAAAPSASSSPPTVAAAIAGVVEMHGHAEHHQRQSPPIWVLLHLTPVFHVGDRRLFHFLSRCRGAAAQGAKAGVQVPAELGPPPVMSIAAPL